MDNGKGSETQNFDGKLYEKVDNNTDVLNYLVILPVIV